MIPLRVYLKGFMSYRDEAELLFEGAPLWVLTGHNGSGKSAIFDAMTFALYGRTHRKVNQNDLIHHDSDGFVVKFDFRIGDDVYRVKRTVSKKGRSTYQAFHLKGPNAPRPGQSGRQAIPETEKEAALRNWVEQTIGLDDKTFTASVLLEQGRSEALLSADPADRHKMLTQIVDLSPYERLYNRAIEKRKEFEADEKSYQNQLADLPPVDDAAIERLTAEIETAMVKVKAAQERLENLAELKVYAERWEQLTDEQTKIQQAMNEARVLFHQAECIERDAERLAELNDVLPRLQRLFKVSERLSQAEGRIAEQTRLAKQWKEALEEAKQQLDPAQKALQKLEAQRDALQRQWNGARDTLLKLAPDQQKLKELDGVRVEVKKIDKNLTEFPENLPSQIAKLQEEVEALFKLKTALPWLNQFTEARDTWRGASQKESEAEAKFTVLAAQESAVLNEQTELMGAVEKAKASAEQMQEKLTQAKTLLEEAKKRLNRFEEVKGNPTCDYCGQPLTPEHREKERQRLEREYLSSNDSVRDVTQRHREALERQLALERKAQTLAKKAKALQDEAQHLKQTLREAGRDQEQAEKQARAALEALPDIYKLRIHPSATADITVCFQSEFPTEDELTQLGHQANQHEMRRRQLEKLNQKATARGKLLAKREQTVKRLSELEADYPDSLAQEMRDKHCVALEEQNEAKRQLEELAPLIESAGIAVDSVHKQVGQLNENQREARRLAENETTRKQELEHSLTHMLSELPDRWQAVGSSLTTEQLANWQKEAESLDGADKRFEQLAEAHREQETRERRLGQIEQERSQIPPEAQCPPGNLETETLKVRQQLEESENMRAQAEREKHALKNRRDRRQKLEKKYRHAAHQAKLYKELADLLGRDNLQRLLLQQAESGIVASANEVLDRISSGTLRLELKPGEEATRNKALDLVAYHTETGEASLPVASLSVGQRFRVAVSLALGIGQYASQGSRRIESVIIDEGFGSLDKEGRREMIDELHTLKESLSRIILVSHQEEFATAFKNGYEMKLEERTSKVFLLGDEGRLQ